ncbi:hypothetical protein ACHAPT_001493 [Fusarium lateritium]
MFSDVAITANEAVSLLNGRFQVDALFKLSKLDIFEFQELSRTASFRNALQREIRVSWTNNACGDWTPTCGHGMAVKRLEDWAASAVYQLKMSGQ